jgi:hypothetical protein
MKLFKALLEVLIPVPLQFEVFPDRRADFAQANEKNLAGSTR